MAILTGPEKSSGDAFKDPASSLGRLAGTEQGNQAKAILHEYLPVH